MATQKDIAEYLKISQQAVSASLGRGSGSVKVSDETRARVLEAARELGYVANHVARSLKSGRTGLVGVIMPLCKDPYYSAVIDALSMEAVKRKYSLMLQFHLWSPDEEAAALHRLREARVEGVLLHTRSAVYSQLELGELIKTMGVPVVALSSTASEDVFYGMVEKDYEEEGFQACSELIAMGHRKIDLLAAISSHPIQQRRMEGAVCAVKKAGVKAVVQHVNPDENAVAMIQPAAPAPIAARDALVPLLVKHYFDFKGRGTGVIVGNEAIAWRLMAEASERGLSIPKDVSVICSGVSGEGATGPLPLTALEYDASEVASSAFGILLDEKQRRIRLSPTLVRRKSVAKRRT